MANLQVLEGTREEIMALLEKPEIAGRRLRLVVLPAEEPQGTEAPDSDHFYFRATNQEFENAFDAIGEGNESLPALPPEAFERESIYEDVP